MPHRVVVIGGGFAGVRACQALRRSDVEVTLVDRRNFHLFQPLLYQVATGGLSPGDIAAPLRTVLRDVKNTRVVLAEVHDIDVDGRVVHARDGERALALPYDTLIVAAGASHSYFGHDEWAAHAPGLKTIEDATAIRAHILRAFEEAELCTDEAERAAWLRFVVVGGGPTGVELAGAVGELAQHTMRGEFRSFRSESARVVLVEGTGRLLSMYTERLSAYARRALAQLGVDVRLDTKVIAIDDGGVDVEAGGARERLPAKTVLWAAGVQGSPLARLLRDKAGAELDRAGRVVVDPALSLPSRPEIVVAGDLACFAHTVDKKPVPGVAPAAMQMGGHAARVVQARLAGRPAPPFRYFDKGTMAVIGRNRAVARVGVVDWGLTGFLAWLAWAFIHILYLVDFENRLLVAVQWANHWFTRHRGARLINLSPPASRSLPGDVRRP